MKRLFCLVLVLVLLSGCGRTQLRTPVTFYYPRAQYHFGSEDGVIAGEQRESAGHVRDLSYLMNLYLMGPAEETLRSPLPEETQLLSASLEGGVVMLTLSDAKSMSESEFSLACACLSLTAMEITGLGTVTIESGERSVTMTREDLTLYDDSAESAVEETQ